MSIKETNESSSDILVVIGAVPVGLFLNRSMASEAVRVKSTEV